LYQWEGRDPSRTWRRFPSEKEGRSDTDLENIRDGVGAWLKKYDATGPGSDGWRKGGEEPRYDSFPAIEKLWRWNAVFRYLSEYRIWRIQKSDVDRFGRDSWNKGHRGCKRERSNCFECHDLSPVGRRMFSFPSAAVSARDARIKRIADGVAPM
jgi:hypothetical protein